jgi:hypothetical protein
MFETLDGAGGTAGRTSDAVGGDVSAAVFGGAIHVFYRDLTTGDLRHGWFNGTTWQFEALDGASIIGGRVNADVGQASVTTIFAGKLEVFYLNVTNSDVRRASFNGTAWTFATIDGDSTAGGHTIHDVGFNLQAKVWGGSLHVFYFEIDPAYGAEFVNLGWVREARLTGTSWTYRRSFRVNRIVPGKTLTVGVVSATQVFVAYQTWLQDEGRLRWRVWDGTTWSSSSSPITAEFEADDSASALFVITAGVPTLFWGSFNDTAYFTWSGSTFTYNSLYPQTGSPTSSVTIGSSAHVFWGAGDPAECCGNGQLLLRTTGP